MPFLNVFILEGATPAQKQAMAEGVTRALCAAYDVGPEIVTLYVVEIPLHDYAHAGNLGEAAPLRRPFVQVHALPRPTERRRELVRGITEAMASALDLAPDLPAVYVFDSAADHVAHGGVLASEAREGSGAASDPRPTTG